MARVFPTVVRRIIQAAASTGAGFIASQVQTGINLTTQLRLIGSSINAGIHTDAGRFSATVAEQAELGVQATLLGATGEVVSAQTPGVAMTAAPGDLGNLDTNTAGISTNPSLREATVSEHAKPGVSTSLLGAQGAVANPSASPGMSVTQSPSSHLSQQAPALEIVQIKYDLTRRVGADGASEYAVLTRQDFDTPANAVGINHATRCRCAGNALGARSGGLQLTYADSVGKTDLTIISATLSFYTEVSSLLGVTTMRHEYRIGSSGAWTVLATRTASLATVSFQDPNPDVFDITAAIAGSWANVDALQASVEAEVPSFAASNYVDVYAVVLTVTATATQTV